MKYVRVRPPTDGGPCAVRHPEHGELVVPSPSEAFRDDDPLVRAYPWLFVSDDTLAALGERSPVTEVRIEDTSARPGARRGSRRA